MGYAHRTVEDLRKQPRDAVEFRARATGSDGRPLALLVVNTSVQGLMARYDAASHIGIDERLSVKLPVIGEVAGVVRWVLGGRIGCELDDPIGAEPYSEMLARATGRR